MQKRGSLRLYYRKDPSVQGLWSFDNDLLDESGNNRHHTESSTVKGRAVLPSRLGGSRLFNGTNAYTRYQGTIISALPFAYGFWFTPEVDYPDVNSHYLACQGGDPSTSGVSPAVYLGGSGDAYTNNGGLRLYVYNGGSQPDAVTAQNAWKKGKPYFIVVGADASGNPVILVNGRRDTQVKTSGSASLQFLANFYHGGSVAYNSDWSNIRVQESIVWNRLPSDKEVMDYYRWATQPVNKDLRVAMLTDVTAAATTPSATFSTIARAAVTGGATISATVPSATFSIPNEQVNVGFTVVATTPSATFSIPAYNVFTPDAMATPSTPSAVFSLPASQVNVGYTVPVNTLSAIFSQPAETATGGATIAAATPSAVFSIPASQVNLAPVITPSTISATFSIPNESVTGDALISAATLSASFSAVAFTVAAARSVIIAQPTLSATFGIIVAPFTGGVWRKTAQVDDSWTKTALSE